MDNFIVYLSTVFNATAMCSKNDSNDRAAWSVFFIGYYYNIWELCKLQTAVFTAAAMCLKRWIRWQFAMTIHPPWWMYRLSNLHRNVFISPQLFLPKPIPTPAGKCSRCLWRASHPFSLIRHDNFPTPIFLFTLNTKTLFQSECELSMINAFVISRIAIKTMVTALIVNKYEVIDYKALVDISIKIYQQKWLLKCNTEQCYLKTSVQ